MFYLLITFWWIFEIYYFFMKYQSCIEFIPSYLLYLFHLNSREFTSSKISVFSSRIRIESIVNVCGIFKRVPFDYLDESDNWSSSSNGQCLICSTSGCGRHRRMCSGHSVDSTVTVVFRQCMPAIPPLYFWQRVYSRLQFCTLNAECCKILRRLMFVSSRVTNILLMSLF